MSIQRDLAWLLAEFITSSEYSQTSSPDCWSFNETINTCIDYAQKSYKDAMATAEHKTAFQEQLKVAVTLLEGAISLIDMHSDLNRYWDSCLGSRKLLGESGFSCN